MTLLVGVNHPEYQEVLVSNWKPACILVEDAISGAKIAPFWLWLPLSCLPASSGGWASPQPASSPLVFAQSFVLCVAHQCLRLELLAGKFFLSFFLSFFFFPLSLAIPQFGLLSHVSSLRLSLGYSGLVLTLSKQPAPPCSAPTPCWWMRVSGLLLCWELQLGTLFVDFFFFPLPAMLSSEIPKLPTDPPVRGSPGVWNLLF